MHDTNGIRERNVHTSMFLMLCFAFFQAQLIRCHSSAKVNNVHSSSTILFPLLMITVDMHALCYLITSGGGRIFFSFFFFFSLSSPPPPPSLYFLSPPLAPLVLMEWQLVGEGFSGAPLHPPLVGSHVLAADELSGGVGSSWKDHDAFWLFLLGRSGHVV